MSDDAGAGWDRFVEANDVPFSALIEATGRLMHQGKTVLESPEVVELARKIATERLKRR